MELFNCFHNKVNTNGLLLSFLTAFFFGKNFSIIYDLMIIMAWLEDGDSETAYAHSGF